MSWTEMLTHKVLTDDEIVSKTVVLQDGKVHHAMEFNVSGVGTITIIPYTSISGSEWISNGAKVSGFGSGDGPESDGKQIIPLLLKPSEIIKFKIVAVGEVEFNLWFTQK